MTVPLPAPRAFAPLFQIERARLLELLRSLDPADWERPTPCPGWSVLGLSIHLLGGDLGLLARQRDGHHGTPAPDGLDEAGFVDWLDELQGEWVHAARRLSPRLVLDLLGWTGGQVAAVIEDQEPSAPRATVSWASSERVPVWLDQARELSERWIHRQQILQALARANDLRPDLAEPVLDALRWAYPFRLTPLDRPPGTAVAITVTGPAARVRWLLVRAHDAWRFERSDDRSIDAELRMTAEQAWRLLTNNYETNAHGDLDVMGDPDIIGILLRTRAIIGSPK